MNAIPSFVHKLFGNKVQYVVPLYQRRYVWEKANWEKLWEDILKQEKLGSIDNRGHFVGPIITRSITGQQDRFEVIDGQQRLITFQIIFCVIRDICKSLNLCKSKENAETHLKNLDDDITIYKLYDKSDEPLDPTYKFIPTDYDKSAFRKIVKEKYGEAISKTSTLEEARSQTFGKENTNHSIVDAYDYFYKVIKESEEISNKIPNILETVKNNLELVQITPSSLQQAEKIFESVNATGRKLSEFDYLRNNLFLRAGDTSDTFYKKYWDFEKDPDYDWDNNTLESFFQAFLMAKLGPNILNKDAKLFDVYQRNLVTGRSLKEEFEDIKNYAEAYKKLDIDIEFGVRMQFYKELSTFYTYEDEESYNPIKASQYNYYITVIRAFILHLQQELNKPKDEILSVFEILESYVARSLLVDTVANDDSYQVIRTFFCGLFLKKDKVFLLGNMIEYLANESKRRWIPNTVIKNWFGGEKRLITWHSLLLKEDRLFSLRYIFYRIENWKRQTAGKEPLSFTEEEFPPDKHSVRTFKQLRHDEGAWRSLGNLTFCWMDNHEQEINTFNNIKAFLREGRNGTLELNNEIYNEPKLKWERRQIKDREKKLVSAFCNLWPTYPWEDINMRYSVDQEVQGTVVRITEDGMYVQLEPAIEGYVSIWEMTWNAHRKIIPSEHFKEGNQIKVKILDIEESKQEIRLSIRQTQPYPWKDIDARYSVNQEVEGTVIEIDQSSITLELEPGVDGVIANKEIAWTSHRNVDPADYVNKGEQIKAKILEISKDQQILQLSIKLTQSSPWKDIDARYSVNQEVEGTVIEIDQSGVTLELEQGIGGRVQDSEIAWTSHRNVDPADYVNKGEQIKAKILEISKDQQILQLSIKLTQSSPWKDIDARYSVNQEVEGTVIEIDQSGVTLELEQGIGGRVQDSEIAWTRDRIIPSEHFKQGDKVIAKILEISEAKQKILLSIKQTQYNNPWKDIETRYFAGTEVQGTVVKIDRYGAIFQLEPGVHGFIHRDEMVWTNFSKDIVPSQIVNEGEEIKAKILEISAQKENLQLSIKQTQPDPWVKFTQNNKEGTVVRGKICNITKFGAFAELEKGISGLIRTSELTDRRLEKPEEVVSYGQELDLKVIEIDEKKRHIRLSLKAVWAKIAEKYKVDAVVQGKIVKLSTFSALVELEEGIEGLIKKHELVGRVEKLSVGTELKVKVTKVDQEKRQIHLQEVTPTLMETRIIAAMKKNTSKSNS